MQSDPIQQCPHCGAVAVKTITTGNSVSPDDPVWGAAPAIIHHDPFCKLRALQ